MYRKNFKKMEMKMKEIVFGTARVYNKSIRSVDKNFVTLTKEEEEIGEWYRAIDAKHSRGIESVSAELCSALGI